MKKIYLTLAFATLLVFAFSQNVATYNFNNLNEGNLNGQDGWKTIQHAASGSPDFAIDYASDAVVSPDGSKAVFYSSGGPNVGRTATRKSSDNFQFNFNSGLVEIEIDIFTNWWGVFFGIGYDADNDGIIAPGLPSEPNDGGLILSLKNAPPKTKEIILPNGTHIPFQANTETWGTYKMSINFSSNNGSGVLSLYYKPGATGEWTPISEVQGLNMQLQPNSGGINDNKKWDGVFFHSQGAIGAFDNLIIRQPQINGEYQYITFEPINNQLTTNQTVTLNANASSGLPVKFSIVSGPATVHNNIVTLSGEPGIVAVKASQEGNDIYAPATDVVNNFEVIKASDYYPELNIKRPADSTKVYMNELKELMIIVETFVEHPEVLKIEEVTFEIDNVKLTASQIGDNYYAASWKPISYGYKAMNVKSKITGGNIIAKSVSFDVTNNINNIEVKTFNGEIATPNNQIINATYKFPCFVGSFNKILSTIDITCPAGGCDPYDRVSHVEIKTPDGNWVEIIRYLTPFGVPCNDKLDVTDYASLLQGNVDIKYHCITWDKGIAIGLKFEFETGSPQYLYSSVKPIWKGEFEFGNISNLQPVPSKNITFENNVKAAKLKLITTGHSWGQNNTGNAAEFFEATHNIKVNNTNKFTQHLWNVCNPNPAGCQPQNGTWYHNRAGWCPGSIGSVFNFDLSEFANSTIKLDYEFDPNYKDYCNASNPNCISGETCPNCNDAYNPLLNVSAYIVTFSDKLTVSNKEINRQNFSIVPNPTKNFFTINNENGNFKNAHIVIVNQLGQVIKSVKYYNGEQIDVSSLSKGIYVVSIYNNSNVYSSKLAIY